MEAFDVVVVGAGPAGSVAARAAAEGGARTLVVDRRPELGQPVQCGEFLPTLEELLRLFDVGDVVADAYRIPAGTVLRSTRRMTVVGPDDRRYSFPLAGHVVSRRAFDKALAFEAEGAGAELRFPAGVTGVGPGEVRFARGGPVRAKVIVAADGPISTVGNAVGLSVPRVMYRMITASSAAPFADEIALYFGGVAPGGYAWAFPRSTDLNVGLGVPGPSDGRGLSALLDGFLAREQLPPATDRTRWWVPIGPPPRSAVRGSVLFAGDAANLVMATNGGGIPTAMISGYDAGVSAARAVREGAPLTDYDRRWKSHLYAPLARGHRLYRLGDAVAGSDALLGIGMRYIGASGLDELMRLKWPARLGGAG